MTLCFSLSGGKQPDMVVTEGSGPPFITCSGCTRTDEMKDVGATLTEETMPKNTILEPRIFEVFGMSWSQASVACEAKSALSSR